MYGVLRHAGFSSRRVYTYACGIMLFLSETVSHGIGRFQYRLRHKPINYYNRQCSEKETGRREGRERKESRWADPTRQPTTQTNKNCVGK